MSKIQGSKKLRSRKSSQKLPQSQNPVSTMQKTGLTNYFSFLVWSGPYGTFRVVNSHFSVYLAILGMATPEQPTNWVIQVQACSLPVRRQSFAILVVRERIGEILVSRWKTASCNALS